METLLADLTDTAGDDILDCRRIDSAPLDQGVEHRRAEIGRVPVAQRAAAPAPGSAQRFDDISFGHAMSDSAWRMDSASHDR